MLKYPFTLLLTAGVLILSLNPAESREKTICSSDLKTWIPKLLEDLPGYTNRVIHREEIGLRSTNFFHYILVAGQPDYHPINRPSQELTTLLPDTTQQVFFTTLERDYLGDTVKQSEAFHWLFLTPTNEGYRMVMMQSRYQVGNSTYQLLPPEDSSNGSIAQGIKLWLRDHCHS